jgi:hypothetical protein
MYVDCRDVQIESWTVIIEQLRPLPDAGEPAVRDAVVSHVEADPERFLCYIGGDSGIVLNAHNAQTLLPEYNEGPAKYLLAVSGKQGQLEGYEFDSTGHHSTDA